jgi:NO-binding membrane sensor protein with MHYT domain
MNHVEHFSLGMSTLLLAYAASVIGSLLGLVCASRLTDAVGTAAKTRWTVLGAVATGGAGIWLMHFIAMLGFATPGGEIRYDLSTTALSALVAVVVVGLGLRIVGWGPFRVWRLLAAGVVAGSGVAAMHYTGMASMQVEGRIGYDSKLVALSVVIAIVAATVALWFAVVLRRGPAVATASLIMGVAVTGMHYTAMAAVRFDADPGRSAGSGAEAFAFVLPVFLISAVVIGGLLYAVLSSAPIEERQLEPVG